MVIQRMSFGFICPDVDIQAVQRRPSPEEQVTIDEYCDKYKAAMRRGPHGLHYLPFPGITETVAVWLPIEEGEVVDERSWAERGIDRGNTGTPLPTK